MEKDEIRIGNKLRSFRTLIRKNSKDFIDHIIDTKISRNNLSNNSSKKIELCIFCNSLINITKEHVIPRWAFDKSPEKYFTTDVNGMNQTYNKTTVPACAQCNNDSLSYLESYIINLFKSKDWEKFSFTNYEIQNIVRWLEIIEYKFQVLDIRKRFISSKQGGFIPFLADFPLSILRKSKDYSPTKVISEIRLARKRITIKSKDKNINSLVVFKTKNESFHFFHNMNEFIFLELPQHKIALFYFYTKGFETNLSAYKEAMGIIKNVYSESNSAS